MRPNFLPRGALLCRPGQDILVYTNPWQLGTGMGSEEGVWGMGGWEAEGGRRPGSQAHFTDARAEAKRGAKSMLTTLSTKEAGQPSGLSCPEMSMVSFAPKEHMCLQDL